MTDSSSFSIDGIDGPDTLRGALILLVLGLGITGYGAYDYVQQSDAIRNAVEVDATVTEVGVETQDSGKGSGKLSYEPHVEFTYDYEGTTYTGTHVYPADVAPSYDLRSNAESVVDDYEEGTSVTAYVDSTDPSHAFLKNKTSNEPLILAGIGAVASLFGAASTLKKYRNN